MSSRRAQLGVTLTELMIVIAIIGVLVAMANVYLKPEVKTIDVATRVGDLIREANRRAVALGPVRADVAVAIETKKARTRVRGITAGPQPTFLLERLQEDAVNPTGVWIGVVQYTVPKEVVAETHAPGVGSHGALSLNASWTALDVKCYPDGTCESRTMFFEAAKPGAESERYARLSVMPIGGAIMTRRDWN